MPMSLQLAPVRESAGIPGLLRGDGWPRRQWGKEGMARRAQRRQEVPSVSGSRANRWETCTTLLGCFCLQLTVAQEEFGVSLV